MSFFVSLALSMFGYVPAFESKAEIIKCLSSLARHPIFNCYHDHALTPMMMMMVLMMMVIARYPCLTYQSTLASYFQSLLTPRSYSLITFFAQLSLSSYSYILLLYSKLRHLLLLVPTCSVRPDDPRISFSPWCHISTRTMGSAREIRPLCSL